MKLRGRSLVIALGGYGVTLALGLAAGSALQAVGWAQQPLLIAIALSATSLGLVVPVLKDAGQVASPVGQAAIAGATVADFAAIVLLSLLFRPPMEAPERRSCCCWRSLRSSRSPVSWCYGPGGRCA